MRTDKWIWAVRMVKSRTVAIEYCKQGKVMVNGVPAKPAKEIKAGDVVEVQSKLSCKTYRVLAFAAKPIPKEKLAHFFEDLTPESVDHEKSAEKTINLDPTRREPKLKYRKDQGRPVKKERRQRDALWFDE